MGKGESGAADLRSALIRSLALPALCPGVGEARLYAWAGDLWYGIRVAHPFGGLERKAAWAARSDWRRWLGS